jgi:hypothetical protein
VFGPEGFQHIAGRDEVNSALQQMMASTGVMDQIIAGAVSTATVQRITQHLGNDPYLTRADGQPAQFAFSSSDNTAPEQLTLEYLQHKYGAVFDQIDSQFADYIRSFSGNSQQLMGEIGHFVAFLQGVSQSPIPGLDVESLRAMQREGEKLTDTFNSITAAWSQYVDLFYTDAEKQQMGMEMLQHQFEALGLEMPHTREEFRHLVDTIDHNSPLWRSLLDLAPAFAQLVPAIDAVGNALARVPGDSAFTFGHVGRTSGFTGSVDDGSTGGGGGSSFGGASTTDDLAGWLSSALTSNGSPLSPAEQLEAARQAWMAHPTAATSSTYIGLARQMYGSSSGYVDIFKNVYDTDAGLIGASDYNSRMEQIQTGIRDDTHQTTHTIGLILEQATATTTILQTIATRGTTTGTTTVELR